MASSQENANAGQDQLSNLQQGAIELVQQNKFTHGGLAEHIGYADVSALAKAFRR